MRYTFFGVSCPAASSFDGDSSSASVFLFLGVFGVNLAAAEISTSGMSAADFLFVVLYLCNRSCTLDNTASLNERK